MNQKISIIVPAYNCENKIEKCIKSISRQTYDNLEIIIVNDGSTDNTALICQKLAHNDERIKVINQENQGVSMARNQGIKCATGEYIQFVDADDTIEPDMTATLVKTMRKYDCQFVICGYNQYKNGNKEIICHPDGEYDLEDFKNVFMEFYNTWMINMPWNKMYKKECIHTQFQSDINLGEDLIFNLEYIKGCHKIAVINYCGYNYYFENGTSLAGSFRKEKIEYSKMLHNKVCEFVGKNQINDKAFVMEIRYSMTNLMRSNLSDDNKKDYIRKWCQDKSIVSAYKCASGLSLMDRVLKVLVLVNKPGIIYYLLKIAIR